MNTQNDKIISAVQSARDDPNNALIRVEIRGFDEDGLLAYYVKIKEFNNERVRGKHVGDVTERLLCQHQKRNNSRKND